MNDDIHATLFEKLDALRKEVRNNASRHEDLLRALEEFKAAYDADRAEDEDIRLLFYRLRAMGRVGRFVRALVGWFVLVGGGLILIFEYIMGKF